MFWFDKQNPNVLFQDIREEDHDFGGGRSIHVHPDVLADVRKMPYADGTFRLVVFDPPHVNHAGESSWLCKKYGCLPKEWKTFINDSIHECMRVLDDYGVLIFKWSETQFKVSEILKDITDYEPLFGHPTRKGGVTKWFCFMKFPSDDISTSERQP